MSETADTLRNALVALRDERERCRAHTSPALGRQFEAVRAWQAAHVKALHQAHAARTDGHDLLRFLTRTFYLEADWSELTRDPDKIAGRIGRIMRDHRPLVIAVQLQTMADTLDAAVAEALLEDGQDVAITPQRYVRAFRAVGERERRERQLAWVDELIDHLGGYADNRAAYWAFKLAGSPAQALGMGRTYGLLADGFAAMRATEDLENTTRDAVARQRTVLHRLLA